MAFSDLQLKVMAEAAIDAIHTDMAPLTFFAHSYNGELEGQYGQAVAIPTTNLADAAEFDPDSNNYAGTSEMGGALVTLDKQYVQSMRISDKNQAYTGVQFAKDAGTAIAKSLARTCNKYAIGLVAANAKSGTWDITSKKGIVELVKLAMENDLPINRSVAIVSPEAWTAILNYIGEYQVYGAGTMMQDGIARNVMGFKAILPSTYLGDGVKGALVADDALGTVSRFLPPVFSDGMTVTRAVDTDNGFIISFREFNDAKTGFGYIAGTTLFGAKVLDENGILVLK